MRKQLLAPIACAMAVCLALFGCGESAPAEPEATEEVVEEAIEEVAEPDGSEYVGTWELYEMKDEDEVISHEDLMATKDAADSYVYLVVNEDGSFDLDVFGTVTSGTWEPSDDGSLSVDYQGEKVTISMDDEGKLTLTESDAPMVFTRIDPSERLSNDGGATSPFDPSYDGSAFVGTWTIYDLTSGEDSISHDGILSLMEDEGFYYRLVINDDGTCALESSYGGDTTDVWGMTSETTAQISTGAGAVAVSLDDEGLLRLDLADGSHQRFERAE